ncbi:MAG: nucleotide disphospho-sugar-binding domain-containing protein [Thermoguttaceae bacterium]
MRILLSTFGSAGDVFPMLGLAIELRRRGHEVTVATNPHFEETVCRHGVVFEALGSHEQYAATVSDPDLWHPRRSFGHIFQTLQQVLRRQYELCAELAGSKDNAAVTNCFGFGALLAQEKLGLPVITLHCQPAVLWSDRAPPTLPGMRGPRWFRSLLFRLGERFFIDPVVTPFLNPWRRELGLPPVRRIVRWWHSPGGVLCMFPEWFCPPQEDWPLGVVQTDFPLWNDRSEEGLAGEVEEFLERHGPPLVFTPGSANIHGREFFGAAAEACRRLDRPGILLTGFAEQIPEKLPAGVAHFSYVPLDLLLPRSAAFIHHGGIGSTSQAMAAGIPQVLMPLAHDQFDNAARIRRLGLGDSIAVRQFTGARLARQLRRLLVSTEIAGACNEVARRLEDRTGLARSAAAVEAMAGRACRM